MDGAIGSRVLNEVGGGNLEEVLDAVRSGYSQGTTHEGYNTANYKAKSTGITELDDIVAKHFRTTRIGGLSITGRYLPLLYKIISTLASPPNGKAIIIIDYEGKFEASRLSCSESDLDHIYVLRPAESTRDRVGDIITNTERYLLYNDAAKESANRELWGTIVIGGFGGGDIAAGWKGWLRVDREEVRQFPPGISIEEALQQREARQEVVDAAGWQASSAWGAFIFHVS